MEREVKGIFIPIEIWEASDLSWNEKILLMEIDSFTGKGKDCFFSNEYIAEMMGVKSHTASNMVASLIRKGYVRQTRFDGRKRYLESCIKIQCRLAQKSEADLQKNAMQTRTKLQGEYIENNKPNTIDISSNEENINIYNNPKPQKFDFLKALLAAGVEPEVAQAWMQVRKAKKAVNTEIAWKAVERELSKTSTPASECIRFAVEHSWSGFKAEWMENEKAPRTAKPAPAAAPAPRDNSFARMMEVGKRLGIIAQSPYDK